MIVMFKAVTNYCSFSTLLNMIIVEIQVAIEVEREEDEGGLVGETFTDYVSVHYFHILPPSILYLSPPI